MEYNAGPGLGELPGSLASSQAASNDVHGESLMRRHSLRIASRTVVAATLAACAPSQEPPEPVSLTADQEWIRTACDPASPDTTGWPRYQLGNVSIAVPPVYRRGRDDGFSLRFRRGTSTLVIMLGRQSAFSLLGYNRLNQVVCDAHFGGYPAEALSWRGRGEYLAVAQWERLNEPSDRSAVQAIVRTTRLVDAEALRLALHTIQRTAAVADTATTNANAWFYSPCLSDSVDSFEWTRYDLRAVRIRVPREFRRVPFPSLDELHFRSGQTTLRLRLHNDASQLFAQYYQPRTTYRHCVGEIGGLAVEAISFRPGWGFAARWADADRGEWLTAVVHGQSLDQVTALRRALFTLSFPGTKR